MSLFLRLWPSLRAGYVLPAKTACERASEYTRVQRTYIHSTTDDRVRTDERACCRMFYFLESRSTVCVLGRVSSEWKVDNCGSEYTSVYIFRVAYNDDDETEDDV